MTIQRAFTFLFDDPKWIEKVIILVIVAGLSGALTPLLVGFVGWAILMGYQTDLIRNVQTGMQHPLPRWNDFGRLVMNGGGVFLAYFIYLIPNLFLSVFTFFVTGLAGNTSIVSSGVSIAISCCLFPFLLVYNLVALPMFAIGHNRYARSGQIAEFFRVGLLFDTLRGNLNAVVQWWIGTAILFVVVVIPIIGWLAGLVLLIPVSGALTGILGNEIAKNKVGVH